MPTQKRSTPREYDEQGNLISKWCNFCKRMLPIEKFNKHVSYKDGHMHKCQKCFNEYWHLNVATKRVQYLVNRIKSKCIKEHIPFNLTVSDIIIPDCCPILGIKLEFGRSDGEKWRDNSPSIDRIIPSLGYVKGNVLVISYRANRIKNDATIEELIRIASYYQEIQHDRLRTTGSNTER